MLAGIDCLFERSSVSQKHILSFIRERPVYWLVLVACVFVFVRVPVEIVWPFDPFNRPHSRVRTIIELPFVMMAYLVMAGVFAVTDVFGVTPGVGTVTRTLLLPSGLLVAVETVSLVVVLYFSYQAVAWVRRWWEKNKI